MLWEVLVQLGDIRKGGILDGAQEERPQMSRDFSSGTAGEISEDSKSKS